jgi:hypothetical protein
MSIETLERKHDFRVIQGCPVGKDIAPYIAISVGDARATVNSIFRGHDAVHILNKHGKHSQDQLFAAWIAYRDHGVYLFGFSPSNPPNPANPPGYSTHEEKSDGEAYAVTRGAWLARWQVGFDVNDGDVLPVIRAAAKYGWRVFQPYPGSRSEFHHLNFKVAPQSPNVRTSARIAALRASLPRS